MRRRKSTATWDVLIFGLLGIGNLGNDASLETVLAWLQQNEPTMRVACLTPCPRELSQRYGVVALPISRSALRNPDGRLGIVRQITDKLLRLPRFTLLARTTQAVVVPGMGVLEDTIPVRAWGFPLDLFLMALACRFARRRFVLLDVGADPGNRLSICWLAAMTARLADHISYRDPGSKSRMEALGARVHDAEVVPDLGFAHPALRRMITESRPLGPLVIGVMDYRAMASRGWPADYLSILKTVALTQLAQGREVRLIVGDQGDGVVARELEREIRSAAMVDHQLQVHDTADFSALLSTLSDADLLIASRYHNLVAALALGKPAIALGYGDKCIELLANVGLGELGVPLNAIQQERVTALTQKALEANHRLAQTVELATRQYAADVEGLLHRVLSSNRSAVRVTHGGGRPV